MSLTGDAAAVFVTQRIREGAKSSRFLIPAVIAKTVGMPGNPVTSSFTTVLSISVDEFPAGLRSCASVLW